MDKTDQEQAIKDVCLIARNAIDHIAVLERKRNKKWVGLTDDEVSKYFEERWTGYSGYFSCFEEVMKWAEEKLRSRNGG